MGRNLLCYFKDGVPYGCSILTLSSYSTGAVASISDSYYQVVNKRITLIDSYLSNIVYSKVPWGHCNDTTTISQEARENLYNPPGVFGTFVEVAYEPFI